MITLRHATPADSAEVSRLIDISGGGGKVPLMELLFPGPREERLRRIQWLFANGDMVYMNHGHYTIAEVNGKVAGALCTFDAMHDRPMEWWRTFSGMNLPLLDRFRILLRLIPYFLVVPPIDPEALVVETVATFREFRGMGVARLLLESAISEGRRKKYRSIQVACLMGNEAALSAYKKAGFSEKRRKTSRLFKKQLGVEGMIHLAINYDEN